jgi:CheY-like chemotaxis protein
MFNDPLLLTIIAVAVVLLILGLFVVKKVSTPKTPRNRPETQERAEVAVREKIEAVSEIKKEPKIEPLSEISVYGTEEGEFVVTTPASEDTVSADRRKSDKTIPKRAVPPIGKITKESFSEFAGERILVAEDNPINQKVIIGLLAGSGIDIVVANDGQEALDILEKDSNFLMILMDAHMPRVDGFEATRIIRANPLYDHILVVALSGDVGADDIQKMESAGMAEQLAKPLRMEALYKIFYAYTDKESQPQATAMGVLDIEEGLQICGGDENFYREILAEFITDYGDSSERLGHFLRMHDLQSADALLLDIVGVAANIGAHPLVDIASHLKHALGDTDEKSYFSLYDRYRVQQERLLQEIRAHLL